MLPIVFIIYFSNLMQFNIYQNNTTLFGSCELLLCVFDTAPSLISAAENGFGGGLSFTNYSGKNPGVFLLKLTLSDDVVDKREKERRSFSALNG